MNSVATTVHAAVRSVVGLRQENAHGSVSADAVLQAFQAAVNLYGAVGALCMRVVSADLCLE